MTRPKTETKTPARAKHMRNLGLPAIRKHLEDGCSIGPRLWGCHNVWSGRHCIGRITDHVFKDLLPALTRMMGDYEVRWRLQDDNAND